MALNSYLEIDCLFNQYISVECKLIINVKLNMRKRYTYYTTKYLIHTIPNYCIKLLKYSRLTVEGKCMTISISAEPRRP